MTANRKSDIKDFLQQNEAYEAPSKNKTKLANFAPRFKLLL